MLTNASADDGRAPGLGAAAAIVTGGGASTNFGAGGGAAGGEGSAAATAGAAAPAEPANVPTPVERTSTTRVDTLMRAPILVDRGPFSQPSHVSRKRLDLGLAQRPPERRHLPLACHDHPRDVVVAGPRLKL